MGIRGAWSLVSNDPRRFGEPWECSALESVIWIDGPSLVYFLALQPKFDDIESFHGHSNQHGQASPASMHRRTKNFIAAMTRLAKEVHVVMDGLCAPRKVPTQIARMKVAAHQADDAARSTLTTRNCKVISILAEWTMVHTILKMGPKTDNLRLHRPATGEAEAYIDEKLSRLDDTHGVAIFSNDTDFLVYANCPGFVPFSSLQFTPSGDGQLTLSGFHYLSNNFSRAFFQNRQDEWLLSTVAGLAGCDYDDERLVSARSIILKSKISGIRVKHQNKPTSQMSLTAVLRYVAHYLQQGAPWMDDLVHSLGDPILLESLHQVHKTYYPGDPLVDQAKLSVEMMRLLQGVFYCRPLIERGSSSNRQAHIPKKACRGINRSVRSRKRQKRKEAMDKQNEDKQLQRISPLPESLGFHEIHPLDYRSVSELLHKQSAWILPSFQRFRVFLYCTIKSTTLQNVVEWRRIGSGHGIDYKQFDVVIPPTDFDSTLDGMAWKSVVGSGRSTSTVALAASILPVEIKWLWLLLVSAPPTLRWKSDNIKCDFDPNIMNLLSLACFHAHLAIEVLDAYPCRAQSPSTSGSCLDLLDEELARWIWSMICDMDATRLPEMFFDTSNVLSDSESRDAWQANLIQVLQT
jgi:hypothetical protein